MIIPFFERVEGRIHLHKKRKEKKGERKEKEAPLILRSPATLPQKTKETGDFRRFTEEKRK